MGQERRASLGVEEEEDEEDSRCDMLRLAMEEEGNFVDGDNFKGGT